MAIFFNQWPQSKTWVSLGLGLLTLSEVWAQSSSAEVQALAQSWALESVQASQAAGAGHLRMDVAVGVLDARLKLAPCGNMEAYLPVGSRLWGKTRVAVRCVDGMSRWNVSLPVTVSAWGKAWVVRAQLSPGTVLALTDVVEAEVNWAEEPSPVVRDPAQWLGYSATRPLTTGQTLRADMVRPAQVFQAGSQVKVVAQGVGFQIASDGQALTVGVIGQTARVRMDNGRVASGIVLDVKTVKIDI
jgi:flagella basal body P-ring formation protein FlgA